MEGLTINPVALFMQAGPVGKFVMMLLAAASLWCWAIIIEEIILIRRLRGAIAEAHEKGESDLLAPVIAEGRRAQSLRVPGESVGERRARIVETMGRAARKVLVATEGGLPNLAIVSSLAPFVGLFGTVWGIMTSFAGIAESQDTSLAVVAPGIAEALAATAFGLAAAIPAGFAFNRLGGSLAHTGESLGDFVEEKAISFVAAEAPAAPAPLAEAA
ncbi:MotA/TolQ/ExbB proton channel family protein [Methylocystis heyeri]|uniref:Flagellar motor protein MotA n=1 Tax=Methylocystis heyeri TaxID=391905 RepID=A0A6B8KBQ5_9HYPH|nr:MotA/TolQ/ExbB proton channel family protein [Methylocystis heyeri]QGM45107.1 flagellar motor protein MotA [Methylocystis heyeri]